jgi:hypothetical protein
MHVALELIPGTIRRPDLENAILGAGQIGFFIDHLEGRIFFGIPTSDGKSGTWFGMYEGIRLPLQIEGHVVPFRMHRVWAPLDVIGAQQLPAVPHRAKMPGVKAVVRAEVGQAQFWNQPTLSWR